MAKPIYPAGFIPALSGEKNCIKHMQKVDTIKQLRRKRDSYTQQSLKYLAAYKNRSIPSRPDSMNLDSCIQYADQMLGKLRYRDEFVSLNREVKGAKQKLKSLGRPNYRAIRKALQPAKYLSPDKGLFHVDIEVMGSSMDGTRFVIDFMIGEHTMKAAHDSVDQNRPSGTDKDWWDRMTTCGVMRPGMHVQVFLTFKHNMIIDCQIGVPFNDHNKSVPFLFCNKDGDYTNYIKDTESGNCHPHMRAGGSYGGSDRNGDYHGVAGCMGSFSPPFNTAFQSQDYVAMCELVIRYMCGFDLRDSWGRNGVLFHNEERLADCEPDRPIWSPQFLITTEGLVDFLNRPGSFHYDYTVYGIGSNAETGDPETTELGSFNTANEAVIESDGFSAIKVTTEQDQSRSISLNRRR